MGFLELVGCGYSKRTSTPEAAAEVTPSYQRPKGAAAFAAVAAASKKQRHRPAAAQWRPSLGSISENGVLSVGGAAEGEKTRADARASAQEKTKAAPISLAAAVARARSGGNSSRQLADQQTAIPALASAPFWF